MRLAYLTSQYPAASHTFIQREVEAMRELGVDVDTFSVRAPSADETVSELDRLEAERTYYLLRQSLLSFAAAHAAALFTHPIAYAKTFGHSLSHRAPGARGARRRR